MYIKSLTLLIVLFSVAQCIPQQFVQIDNSGTDGTIPDDIIKRFELLTSTSSPSSRRHNQRIEQKEHKKPQTNIDELIGNPFFQEFLNEFNKHVQQKTQIQEQTTTPPSTQFPNNPFLQQLNTFPQLTYTQKPSHHAEFTTKLPPQLLTTHQFPIGNPFLHNPSNMFVELKKEPKIIRQKSRRISTTTPLPPAPQYNLLAKISPAVQAPLVSLSKTHEEIVTIPSNVQPNLEIFSFPTIKPQTIIQQRKVSNDDSDEKLFRKQAESAKYKFASEIDDTINGNLHQRQEVRDGLSVKGKYTYSDGFFKRTVHYEADDKGYRVVNEEVEPIGNGPQINPQGHAKVTAYVDGNAVKYEITQADIQEKKKIGYGAVPFSEDDDEDEMKRK